MQFLQSSMTSIASSALKSFGSKMKVSDWGLSKIPNIVPGKDTISKFSKPSVMYDNMTTRAKNTLTKSGMPSSIVGISAHRMSPREMQRTNYGPKNLNRFNLSVAIHNDIKGRNLQKTYNASLRDFQNKASSFQDMDLRHDLMKKEHNDDNEFLGNTNHYPRHEASDMKRSETEKDAHEQLFRESQKKYFQSLEHYSRYLKNPHASSTDSALHTFAQKSALRSPLTERQKSPPLAPPRRPPPSLLSTKEQNSPLTAPPKRPPPSLTQQLNDMLAGKSNERPFYAPDPSPIRSGPQQPQLSLNSNHFPDERPFWMPDPM